MSIQEELLNIQESIDDAYDQYAEQDFQIKYNHYKSIEDSLKSRDRLIEEGISKKELPEYYQKVFIKYDTSGDILPLDSENKIDSTWIKSVVARYEEGFNLYAEIQLNENEYLNNDVIFKRFNLKTGKSESSPFKWIKKVDARIFDYFESEREDLMLFDILYEIYTDSVFYYFLEDLDEC